MFCQVALVGVFLTARTAHEGTVLVGLRVRVQSKLICVALVAHYAEKFRLLLPSITVAILKMPF